ncbi:hypothetical protein E3Q13_01060 [Wallemia mellicola]|nr:hypothetical protein E3Q13_01060 [Wallemia mellicola]
MSKLNEILNRISSQSNEILEINKKPKPVKQSWTVKAALGYIDILDYLRDADTTEVKLFKSQQLDTSVKSVNTFDDDQFSSKLIRRTIEAPTPLRVRPQTGKEYDIEVLLNAASKLIDEYRPLPRTKQHIRNLRKQFQEVEERMQNYQNIIDSPLDSKMEDLPERQQLQNDSASPQELIRVQTEEVKKMQAKVIALKKRKEVLSATVKAQKLEAQVKSTSRQAPPTPIQLPLRQMKEIQKRANTPRKPKLATDQREAEIMKGLPQDDEDDSFKLGNENTLNQSTLLGNTSDEMNLMPSTPTLPSGGGSDMFMNMDTPQPQSHAPPKQPQFEFEDEPESIDLTMRKPTPPSSPEFDPPPKFKDIEKAASTTPMATPKEKTPIPEPPSAIPERDTTPMIETTPEIEAAIKLIWNGFGDVVKPKDATSESMDTPHVDRMVQLLRDAIEIVPAASQQNEPGSPTHSILSIASSLTNAKELNNPQTATSAALLLKLLTTSENRLSMQEAKDHLGLLIQSKGWPSELPTKSIYALVGKRLIKLDRKGASATLRFNI